MNERDRLILEAADRQIRRYLRLEALFLYVMLFVIGATAIILAVKKGLI